MKDPSDDIRDWIYTVLNNNVVYNTAAVPVYSFPPENVSYPYIVIGEQSGEGEDGAKNKWIWDITTQIHVYVNTITSSCWQLLRTLDTPDSYATDEDTVALTNYALIRVHIGAFNTERILNENEIIISKQFSINLLVEEE
jgi:hypothetical protein